ncbi:hypothetical protein [Pseudoduganella sp. R-43]|uniref:hypothetical protein n=1 Tax=unclassified Pseudoduganella TaxID=2637179 RepID=UPI003CF50F69
MIIVRVDDNGFLSEVRRKAVLAIAFPPAVVAWKASTPAPDEQELFAALPQPFWAYKITVPSQEY